MATTQATPIIAETEQQFVLSSISWRQYESVLQTFPEHAGLRITFLDGRLTFVSPTRRHDWFEKALGRFVEAISEGLEIECEVSGHATYRRDDLGAGVEGDQAYYFGEHAVLMRGPIGVDLAAQPPPDLAIEVEATRSADDSVAVWARLGVSEVWRVQVNPMSVSFNVLRGDGTYWLAQRSAAFPVLEPDDLSRQLALAEQTGWSRWVRQLNEWVRVELLPRQKG